MTDDKNSKYDYVIVGGGTAGLVLANRLTEDPNISVLVLEAGAIRLQDPKINIPGLSARLQDDPDYDWRFWTIPQEHLYGKRIPHSRGKVLGGSSAINVLAIVYPHRSSIDAWEELGNEGWNWDTLQPYYQKYTTYNAPSEKTADILETGYIDEGIQGKSGPIQTSFPEVLGSVSSAWPKTWKNLGMLASHDPISGLGIGGFSSLSSVDPKRRERSYAASAYYAPIAETRKNLRVLSRAMVHKIILEEAEGSVNAKSVEYTHNEVTSTIAAEKEILLCAGVFQSPQLLELSGVGNPDILRKHDIKVLVDNPDVGENLQDHPMTGMCMEVKESVPTADSIIRDPAKVKAAMEAYQSDRTGLLAGAFHSLACIPLVEGLNEPGRTEIKNKIDEHLNSKSASSVTSSPAAASQNISLRSMLLNPDEASVVIGCGPLQRHFNKEKQGEVFAVSDPGNYISFLVALTNPFSRGSSHISSASPSDAPVIDPKYLSHPLDVELLARHMQYIPVIAGTEPLVDLVKPNGKNLPEGMDLSTVEQAKEHCRRNMVTNNHPCGTCAMMPRDKGGVVDKDLRVYGVNNLRVIDASIFPLIPKGNIQTSVYAVAELAADLLKTA